MRSRPARVAAAAFKLTRIVNRMGWRGHLALPYSRQRREIRGGRPGRWPVSGGALPLLERPTRMGSTAMRSCGSIGQAGNAALDDGFHLPNAVRVLVNSAIARKAAHSGDVAHDAIGPGILIGP